MSNVKAGDFAGAFRAAIGCDAVGCLADGKSIRRALAPIFFRGDINAPGAWATSPVGAAVLPRG